MALLAGAVILWWLSGPLVAENRIPFPRHDHRYTRRVFPVVPADLTQDALYGLNGKVWIGHHSGSLTFPLVSRKQNPLVLWSPVLEISNDRLTLNGREVTRAELHDQLVHELSTDRQLRQLRGDDGSRSPLIMALPNLPLHVVMDVLAVVYDMGSREVRFVTGLPETIQRPSFGALTRVIYQTTTVNLARAGDIDSMNPHHVLRLSKDLKRYRDVLDRLFESEPTSSPSVLLLD